MNERMCDLELEMLSPCFMGGAYQQPEFRIGSIRGLWRYWYRALYGNGLQTSCSNEEDELFGATPGGEGQVSGKKGGGRGKARLIPTAPLPAGEAVPWRKSGQPTGADYLLFSMSMQKPDREYLKPSLLVSLKLLVRGSETDFDRTARSLAAAFAFSGIGSRARRMAGATHLNAKADAPPYFFSVPASDPASLAGRLRELIMPAMKFSHERRIESPQYHVVASGWFRAGVLSKSFGSWREALDETGDALRNFRLRRAPDYALAKAMAREGVKPAPDQTITRVAFGLPLEFRFKSDSNHTVRVTMPDSDRRGSPFFITLERLNDGRLAVVWAAFRSAFSPGGVITMTRFERDQQTGKKKPIGSARIADPGTSIIDALLGEPCWQGQHPIAE